MEQLEFSYSHEEILTDYEKLFGSITKKKTSNSPEIPHLTTKKKMDTYIHQKTHIRMFIATQFVMTQNRK